MNMLCLRFYYKPKMEHVENFKGQVELLDWDAFRASHDCAKLASQTSTNYDMLDDEYCDYLQERAKFIICNFYGLERCIERVDKYGSDGFDATEYVVERNIEASELAERRGGFVLDMGKLMDCDIRTYGMLCNYLETEPLNGWQDIVNKHKEMIGFA